MKAVPCLALLLGLASALVHAQSLSPRHSLDAVVQNLAQERNWKSKTAIPQLETVLTGSRDTNEVQTAKVLLAFYLTESVTSVQSKDPSGRIRALCDQVLVDGPGTWQASVARVLLVAERDFSGDRQAEISMATNALATIDFEAVEAVRDPAWLAIRKALGDRPYALRETLKVALANALCEEDRLSDAEEVLSRMTDERYAKAIRDRVELGKKMRKEREERQRKQPSPTN